MGAALRALGEPASILAEGQATLDRGTLILALPGGRALAEGRRATRSPAVREALDRCYPPGTPLEVIALPDTGSAQDRQNALVRMALADPAMQRIVKAFDATLHRVTPLTDAEG